MGTCVWRWKDVKEREGRVVVRRRFSGLERVCLQMPLGEWRNERDCWGARGNGELSLWDAITGLA